MLALDPTTADRGTAMSDLEPMSTAHAIEALVHDAKGITLEWDDGLRSRFHVLWLRDNCACPRCRHPQALERTYMFVEHDVPAIIGAELGNDGVVEVQFQAGADRHAARYTTAWLRLHDHTEAQARLRQSRPRLWDATISSRLPTVGYASYM